MKFFSLDIKTANSDPSSICEIGIGTFEDGVLIDTYRSYIDPECPIDPFYTENVHGITEEMAQRFYTFDMAYDFDGLREMLEKKVVVHYSQFPRMAFETAIEKYDLESFMIFWLDSELVALITWEEFSEEKYSLNEVASFLNIEIAYPDALNGAITAGKIVIEACKKSGIGVTELLNRVENVRVE
jgi:DNA polymerase III subunit epsilon